MKAVPTRRAASFVGGLIAVALAALATPAVPARAANVSGTLTAADAKPLSARQVHFENLVTHDIFLVETNAEGKFSADLPEGTYSLRTERGAVAVSSIKVGQADAALGSVKDPGTLAAMWPFSRQGVTRAAVTTPAPSTANIPTIEELDAEAASKPTSSSSAASAQSLEPPGKQP